MADPEFSGGGANTKAIIRPIFPQKLHENERILTERGCASPWVRQCFTTHQHRWVTLSLRAAAGNLITEGKTYFSHDQWVRKFNWDCWSSYNLISSCTAKQFDIPWVHVYVGEWPEGSGGYGWSSFFPCIQCPPDPQTFPVNWLIPQDSRTQHSYSVA